MRKAKISEKERKEDIDLVFVSSLCVYKMATNNNENVHKMKLCIKM